MTINQSPIPEMGNKLDFVVMNPPPNDNTDGRECPCGHAESAHRPVEAQGDTTWRCAFCACTRAPAPV